MIAVCSKDSDPVLATSSELIQLMFWQKVVNKNEKKKILNFGTTMPTKSLRIFIYNGKEKGKKMTKQTATNTFV